MTVVALVYAELGATYPVAGGGARFPYYSHGPIAGFTAGWASWLQAVFIAPIEVLAAITYVNSVTWVNTHFNMINKVGDSAGLLNGTGLIVAVALHIIAAAQLTVMNRKARPVRYKSHRDYIAAGTRVSIAGRAASVVSLPFELGVKTGRNRD